MLNKLWSAFLKALWPLLWPIIRDNMIELAQDLAAWIRKALADRFNATTEVQQKNAEDRARDAQRQAYEAATEEGRMKANAKAEAWRDVAEKLQKDNEELRLQLEEAISLSQVYARKRIDSEAEQYRVQRKVQSLKHPSDADSL